MCRGWFENLHHEPFYSWASTFQELAEGGYDTALLCIGAIEQHSYHLPLSTDWLLGMSGSRRLARALAERGLKVYLSPPLPFGCSSEHLNFRGTISLNPVTLATILKDIVACLKHQGFKRLIVSSSHGGNWILKPAIRELNMWDADFQVMWNDAVGAGGAGPGVDRHAGQGETSRMLHDYPELLREGVSVDCSPDLGSEFVDMIPMESFTPSGVWGFPSKASVEGVAERIEQTVARQAGYVVDTIKRLDDLRQARNAAGSSP
ncbi:MAG: creatininase family protein [Chloroflexi bacterium]|nr:creatininase family protein [Chloroflexota bacterium]